MSDYKGSVELISGITPANGGDFPLVSDNDVLLENGARLSDLKINGVKPDASGNVSVSGGGGGSLSARIIDSLLIVDLSGSLTARIQDGFLVVG